MLTNRCARIALLLISCLLPGASGYAQSLDAREVVIFQDPLGNDPIDLDAWLQRQDGNVPPWGRPCEECGPDRSRPWHWQAVPAGTLYKSYLAGVHEPRFGTVAFHEKTLGGTWDSTLGGRVGLLRYGSGGAACPQGFQVDFEGAVFIRQDDQGEMVANDFRAGVPLTYAIGRYQMKLAFYHLSSHLGDEFLLRTGTTRINFARDTLVWGHSVYFRDALRAYFEVGYAFASDGGSRPWEFQFGAEYSPLWATDLCGAPFLALNGHLRQEVNFGGNFVAQAGWQWRGGDCGRLLRLGLQYYNGKSAQFEFFDRFEHQLGFGIWYDF